MLRNFNEYLSVISLTIICLIALSLGLGAVFSSDNDGTFYNNLELLIHYDDNEEE